MAYIGKAPTVGNFQVCDAISVVNGQAAYTLQVGGVNVAPESANHMLVSLNGILQKPGSSFTISGSTMTFASNLATGDVIDFVQILGNVLDIGQPSDDTVKTATIQANAVTGAKLNTDIISAQTALGATPADTDELLVSDAGVLKRVDFSHIKGGGIVAKLGFEQDNPSTTGSSSSSFVDVGSDIAFTPTSASNTININYKFDGSMGGGPGQYKLVRTIGGTSTDVVTIDISASTNNFRKDDWYVDTSHNTTSEIVYKLQMKSTNGGHVIYIDQYTVSFFIIETTS